MTDTAQLRKRLDICYAQLFCVGTLPKTILQDLREAGDTIERLTAERDANLDNWSRFHHLMAKHGLHPGRTDDDLIEVLDTKLDALAKGQTELNALLFAIDTQAGNGMIPWPIEDAYAAYEAAMKEQPCSD